MLSKHINILEMEAVFRTCHHFQDQLRDKLVLIKCDNSTVVSYINKEGGTRSPSLGMLAWKLLIWAEKRNISLTAEHIPGVENCLADKLSRTFASPLEWRLNPSVVQKIFHQWGTPLIDLFASADNRQTQVFCSRFPEPQAYHVNALSLDWEGMFGYAFPPISLIPLVLERVVRFRCTIILIAPRWARRSWFPRLLELSVDTPCSLPVTPNLLTQDRGWLQHPTPERLQLVAWLLSGDASSVMDFRRRLSTQCSSRLEGALQSNMSASGRSLFAGAVLGQLIPLQPL
jgi:hypothetical protein